MKETAGLLLFLETLGGIHCLAFSSFLRLPAILGSYSFLRCKERDGGLGAFPNTSHHFDLLSVSFFYSFFGHAVWCAGSQFPNQGSDLCPQHWEHGVLTTGPPGKSAPFFTFKDLSDYSGPTQVIQDHLLILIISLTHNLNSPSPSPHHTILNWDQLQSPFQHMQ